MRGHEHQSSNLCATVCSPATLSDMAGDVRARGKEEADQIRAAADRDAQTTQADRQADLEALADRAADLKKAAGKV